MDQLITQETLAELLQLGGQYLLPLAALLRSLYHGMRGKVPQSVTEIGTASVITGLTSLVDDPNLLNDPNAVLQTVLTSALTNTVFMAGLLAFIVIYLLRLPSFHYFVDGVVGAFAGFVIWFVWGLFLADWPAWSIPVTVFGSAAGFIVLRFLLRKLARLMRIATYFIIIGILLIAGAGGILLLTSLAGSPEAGAIVTPPF